MGSGYRAVTEYHFALVFFWRVLPLLAGLLSVSLADNVDEEMTVVADRLGTARAAIDAEMAARGYRRHTRSSGRIVYRPGGADRWKPTVVLDPEGLYRFRSAVVGFQALDIVPAAPAAEDVPGVQAPSSISVQARFWMVSRRKLAAQESMLSDVLDPLVSDVRGALSALHHAERLAALPGQLEARWAQDEPEAVRAWLASVYLSRADTPEGDAVRAALMDFIVAVVERSAHPFTPEERAAFEAACGCAFPAVSAPGSGPREASPPPRPAR